MLSGVTQGAREVERNQKRYAEMLGQLHGDRHRENGGRRNRPALPLSIGRHPWESARRDQGIEPPSVDPECVRDDSSTICAQMIPTEMELL